MTGEEFCDIVQGTVIIDRDGYAYVMGNDHLYSDNPDEPFSIIRFHKFNYRDARIATEEEAQNFFKKLEEHGYIWNSEKNDIEKTSKRVEDENLLFEDLSGRLKYGVKCDRFGQAYPLVGIKTKPYVQFELERGKGDTAFYTANEIKPYLRPMSDMTDEEFEEWTEYVIPGIPSQDGSHIMAAILDDDLDKAVNWLNKHQFDWRGLIPKGLALAATKDMYK